MATNYNSTRKTNNLVNWGTVWGLIFTAIALDLYINYNENQQDKETYRSQYEAKASEADSLRAVKMQLERQILEMKATQTSSVSTDNTTVMVSGEDR